MDKVLAAYPTPFYEDTCGPNSDMKCWDWAMYPFRHWTTKEIYCRDRNDPQTCAVEEEEQEEEDQPTPSPSGTGTEKRIPGYRPSALDYPPAQTAGINLTHLALGGIALYAAYHYLVKK